METELCGNFSEMKWKFTQFWVLTEKQQEKCRSQLWHKIYGLTRSFAAISIKISLLPQLSFPRVAFKLRFSIFGTFSDMQKSLRWNHDKVRY